VSTPLSPRSQTNGAAQLLQRVQQGLPVHDEDESHRQAERRAIIRLRRRLWSARGLHALARELKANNVGLFWSSGTTATENARLRTWRATLLATLAAAFQSSDGMRYATGLALHVAAAEEFNLSRVVHAADPKALADGRQLVASHGKVLRRYLRQQYQLTQSLLAGIERVVAYRGVIAPRRVGTRPLTIDPELNPLNSFSLKAKFARTFPQQRPPRPGECYVVYASDVPVERILSVPTTGIGSYWERELVVDGEPATPRARRRR
jgi:hypothetical protein